MRKIILFIAMSLDGYIADENGGVGWLEGQMPGGDDIASYEEFIQDIDTVIMGARTYHQLATELSAEGWVYADLTSYVITHHPECDRDHIIFTRESPGELVRRLKEKEGKDIWICGGAKIVKQLVKEDLIDRYYMNMIPTILGGGIRLFGDSAGSRDDSGQSPAEIKLKLVKTKSYNGITDLVYERR